MENSTEIKNIISDAKNIYLIPSHDPEAITSVLALFYTLKNLSKNVNLILDNLPEGLKVLAPSLDSISYPKNFVISVPNNVAQISQVYYEKGDDALKIHLTLDNGNIKKENIQFYFAETKPDLVITVGVEDYSKELSNKLNSFGFLLDSPILNIDNKPNNKKFGKINLLTNFSLTESVFGLIKEIDSQIKKEPATCLLSGLGLYTENFRNKITAEIFQTASDLMKSGAELKDLNIK